ncbi:MAG TPA: GDP-mannose 4,6-dehydratase [Candidatus Norongarragalinales archaeon]|nr:GDP-mannose 4,6-dehydratase [Candidatus Norongarragalinales archaeon]
MKKAFITGITGQDGSYLAEMLLRKKYEVFGLVRRQSSPNYWRIEGIRDRISFVEGDLADQQSLNSAVKEIQPDEVYNFAAQSFVRTSFREPIHTADITALGALRMLEAIRYFSPHSRFYQASSSEMFGKVLETPQSEKTPFYPRSPYGVSKVFAHYATVNYRESYGLYACSGISFNHESPRRGIEFVTRKISDGVAKIHLKKSSLITLGNMEAMRDWGFAGDYVEAMWLMLQQKMPGDYVIASGESKSVRDFLVEAFKVVGIEKWEKHIGVDPKFLRPAEVDFLRGDHSRIKQELGWAPKTSFKELVRMMVEADIERIKSGTSNV